MAVAGSLSCQMPNPMPATDWADPIDASWSRQVTWRGVASDGHFSALLGATYVATGKSLLSRPSVMVVANEGSRRKKKSVIRPRRLRDVAQLRAIWPSQVA